MSGSVSGGSQKQSGTESNQFSGSNSGSTRVVAPEGWEEFWGQTQPGQGGYTPDQQVGVDWTKGALGTDAGQQDPARAYFGEQMNRGSHTLQSLAQQYPELYGEQPSVSAGQVGQAATGAQFMDAYQNPYTEQVIDASLGDLGEAYKRNQSASNMQAAASGAFGGGRHGIRDAQVADDYLRNVSSTTAGLRNQGFNTAAGFGQGDANRDLSGKVAQAGMDTQASQANANLLNQRQMFDVNAAYQGDAMRDQSALTNAALGGNQFAIDQGLAGSLFNQGGAGQGQNMDWLNMGRSLFGQDTEGSTSGTSSGTSSGRGSSKGGGIGIG
jgi:hypothetical protein